MQKEDLFKIFLLFASWRILLFILAYFSPQFLPEFENSFPYAKERLISTGLPHFIWSFGNFDGVHYLGIARDAYAYQFTQAFFPLYPILIKILSIVFLSNFLISGLVISNLTFLLGLIMFFLLVDKVFNKHTAYWSTIFLLCFPTSYYFGAVYTESLFFLLTVSAFYFSQNNNSLFAALFGFFASLTRLIGIFLFPSLIFVKNLKRKYLLIIIPFGLLTYMGYLYFKFDNPFYFLTSQEIFGQGRSSGEIVLPPQVLIRYFRILTTASGPALPIAAFELAVTIFSFAVLALKRKSLKAEWLVFSVLSLLLPISTGTLASMPRYVLLAFPIFISLALIKSNAIKSAIAIIFALLLAITTTFFTQGYWVA